MSYSVQLRLVAALLIFVFANTSLFAQLFRNVPRRVERQPAAAAPRDTAPPRTPSSRVAVPRTERQPAERQTRTERTRPERQPAVTATSPADAIEQLQRLTNEIKSETRIISENDLQRSQRLLLDAVTDLQRRLPREFDRETASDWITTFQLAELRAALNTATPEPALLNAVQNAFYSGKEGILLTTFDGLRTALRRYQTVARMLQDGSYERQLTSVCDNLVNYIGAYSEGRNPLYFVTLSDAVAWLDDISIIDPRAARLVELTRIAYSGVNINLKVGSGFVGAGFKQPIDEALDINETILGTKVVGTGTLLGTSSGELVLSPNRAVIKVLAEAEMESHTEGSQRMVTLQTHTTGTLRGEKQILFSAEGITTLPATTRANLNADISDVNINAGRIVQRVARNQVDTRRGESQAEAARRAERRMNEQMNERINPNIAELNERYQKIRKLLTQTGLFPKVWNLASTPQQIDWSIQLGNQYQPSAPVPAPAIPETNGLAVQVHQSAFNNMLAIILSGRSIDEDKFAARVGEFFEEPPAFLERKADVNPAKVSFGTRAPVDVLFVDDKIRVVVRLNDIHVMDNTSRSFNISVEYQIKRENREGRNIIILEQTEAEAFPIGHRRGEDTLSVTQMAIRSYLQRRLEALPKVQEATALDLGGEWAGKGQLVPKFASAENGWLTLVWNWQEQ